MSAGSVQDVMASVATAIENAEKLAAKLCVTPKFHCDITRKLEGAKSRLTDLQTAVAEGVVGNGHTRAARAAVGDAQLELAKIIDLHVRDMTKKRAPASSIAAFEKGAESLRASAAGNHRVATD